MALKCRTDIKRAIVKKAIAPHVSKNVQQTSFDTLFIANEAFPSGKTQVYKIAESIVNRANKDFQGNVAYRREMSNGQEVVFNPSQDLVTVYYNEYLKGLTEAEARAIQRADAERAGIEYDDNYLFDTDYNYIREAQAPVTITPNDKVIFGHPTIGKSYLKDKGSDAFISLDDDYKTEINNAVNDIAKKYNIDAYQVKDGGTQQWNIEYNIMMQKMFDIAKQKALSENKTLFTSNTNLLSSNLNSFDKIINITEQEFEKRIKERQSKGGAKYDIKQWKSQLNAVISRAPANKVILTNKYLSDLLPTESKSTSAAYFQNSLYDLYDMYEDMANLELTPEVIEYLYSDSSKRMRIDKFAQAAKDLVANLRGMNYTNDEILEKIKCL